MMFRSSTFLISLIVLAISCSPKKNDVPSLDVVKTNEGFISGTTVDSVHIFKGIPFAAPPVGNLRWKAPMPHAPWTDTLACNAFGASPIQNEPKAFMMWSEEFITPPQPLSEDCLFLNVWTAAKSPDDKRPVLVWIHGGAFLSGSGACAIYDGEALARSGIVYVSINYRLGVFGFMAHPSLTAESSTKSSGNYGMMDQIASLQWVKDNIRAFGGDPDRVTIAGQSAGSMAVQVLVASPLAKGLFRGAIAESGAGTNRPSPMLSDAEKTGLTLSKKLNTERIESLRALPADSVLALANTLPFGSFFPITDGYVLPTDMRTIFEKKQHNDVPLIAGWVTGDAELAMRDVQPAKTFIANARKTYGKKSAEYLQLFPATSDSIAKESQRKQAMMQFAGYPDHLWALANTSGTYMYQFSYVPTDKPGFPNYGAFHTAEVPFALHTLKYWNRPWKETDYDVENYLSDYWLAFVKTGNPNGTGFAEWKKYDDKEGVIMEFGTTAVSRPGWYAKEFAFFSETSK